MIVCVVCARARISMWKKEVKKKNYREARAIKKRGASSLGSFFACSDERPFRT